ncbi:MAG: PLP-dependent transferase [Puniceicoccales bacterium]|jgi:cystathionine gamma-synthase|nr:PLP-dependent transferase [Puniceicoccales bacterium]
MSAFRHIPLGEAVPHSPHAVVVSLPTVADVIGYEERRPETMDTVRTAYPRFVRHPFVVEAARKLAEDARIGTRALFPVATTAAAHQVARFAGIAEADFGVVETDGWTLLHLPPEDPEPARRAGKIIQHIGTGLSSRQAEDWLVAHGHRAAAAPEALFAGDGTDAILRELAPLLAPADAAQGDILICRAGMNAFYAAFEAARAVQRPRGRTLWLQLGWLYTDTTETLRKCLAKDESFHFIADVFDKNAIEKFFAENGSRLAGVVTEAPTNPLIQTPDLDWLSALALRHGVIRIFDPSTSGLVNVDLLSRADVLVTSLTKYAAHQGDVMSGVLAVNPASPHHAALRETARLAHSPAYGRDLARLAAQIGDMKAVAARVNANTARLAVWLEKHPAVRRVHWTGASASAANYATVARSPDATGGMISIELVGPLAQFYDRIKTVKGPSCGTVFTIVSPFIYMAHYDLVTAPAPRRSLQACGIDPELVRISVGAEPYEELQAVFAEAL